MIRVARKHWHAILFASLILVEAIAYQLKMEDGDVFGLVTIWPGTDYAHLRPVYILSDGTLALSKIDDSAREFRGVSYEELGIIFSPEPIRVLNLQPDHSIRFEENLHKPTVGWTIEGKLELNSFGNAVICPTFPDDKIFWATDGFTCPQRVDIDLMTIPIKMRKVPMQIMDDNSDHKHVDKV